MRFCFDVFCLWSKYISKNDLLNVRSVCKCWNEFATCDEIWKPVFIKECTRISPAQDTRYKYKRCPTCTCSKEYYENRTHAVFCIHKCPLVITGHEYNQYGKKSCSSRFVGAMHDMYSKVDEHTNYIYKRVKSGYFYELIRWKVNCKVKNEKRKLKKLYDEKERHESDLASWQIILLVAKGGSINLYDHKALLEKSTYGANSIFERENEGHARSMIDIISRNLLNVTAKYNILKQTVPTLESEKLTLFQRLGIETKVAPLRHTQIYAFVPYILTKNQQVQLWQTERKSHSFERHISKITMTMYNGEGREKRRRIH